MADPRRVGIRRLPQVSPRKAVAEDRRPSRRPKAAHAGAASGGDRRARRHRGRLVHPPGAGPGRPPLRSHHRRPGRRAAPGRNRGAHLAVLAHHPTARPPFVRETVPPAVKRLIEGLDRPAYATGRRWDVLAWNDAAEQVFAFGRLPEEDRNTLLLMMTNRQTRKAYGAGWADVAKRMVAMFRATHDVWAGDPAFHGIADAAAPGQSGIRQMVGKRTQTAAPPRASRP